MTARSAAIGAVLATLVGAATTTQAQQRSAPVRIVAALPNADATQSVLVGSSGQLYTRDAERAIWRRERIGGVAVAVHGAVQGLQGQIFVVGARTPLYRWTQDAWNASPLDNRGTTVLGSSSSLPVLAVGRHIYLQRGQRWVRKTTSNRQVTAVWARNLKQLYVADARGKLRYYNGSWSRLRLRLPPGDHVVSFAGDKKDVFGRTHNGAVVRLRARKATLLAPAPELGTFLAKEIAPAQAGGAWVLGISTKDGGPRAILARTRKNQISYAEDLPAIDAGDRFTVLQSDARGGLLLVTERGAVHMRSPTGQWTRGQVSGELPPSATRIFKAAPARSH